MNLEKLFVAVYAECNLKPVFERVLREMAVPFNLGLNMIRNLVTTDVAKQPDKVRTTLNKLLAMDRGANRTDPTFLNSSGQEVNFQEWITAILNEIRQEREKTYSNDLTHATQYIQQVSEEVYNDLNV
jgi:hypothetical protein